jgi:SAM-dependent methyltransferase
MWTSGTVYESYVGRWSRLVAREMLTWLEVPPEGTWLDVGCGTGALTSTILAHATPRQVTGVDQSGAFIAHAQDHVTDPRARFVVGDARALPFEDGIFDAVVSGLMLNFVPEPDRALEEMERVTFPGRTVAVYIWDYAGGMQMMRAFWDVAVELDPAAATLDEAQRFAIAGAGGLERSFHRAGFRDVAVRAIDIPTVFRDFDDYWTPFLAGGAPAPDYVRSLDEHRRAVLREELRGRLPIAPDGSLHLTARAWCARGTRW